MNIGKVPENILKKNVINRIEKRRSEILIGSGVGEDCAVLDFENHVTVLSDAVTDPISGNVSLAVIKAVNNIASMGAEPVAILTSYILPRGFSEKELKAVAKEIEITCKGLNISVAGGHSELNESVLKPVISVTGVGKADKNKLTCTSNIRPGDDIVITKWVGLEATVYLAKEHEEKLIEKFPQRMIYEAAAYDRYLSIVPEAAGAVKSGAAAMHDVSTGGIFTALFEMAEAAGVGLTADIKKIPIKQETVEICNFFDLNPYEIASAGSLLIAAKDGKALVKAFSEEKINAAVIGKFTDSNDRIIINGDNVRFLEPFRNDEIYKMKEKKL